MRDAESPDSLDAVCLSKGCTFKGGGEADGGSIPKKHPLPRLEHHHTTLIPDFRHYHHVAIR